MAEIQTPERTEPSATAPPVGTVGALLRAARERLGHELRDVADALRIRFAYMRAIEDGRYEELPGSTYAVGFIRSYAEYLGLDESEVVRRFKEETAGSFRGSPLETPQPHSDGGVPGPVLLAGAAVLIALGFGAWYYVSEINRPATEAVPPVPERLADDVPLPMREDAAPAPVEPNMEAPEPPEPVSPEPEPDAAGSGETGETGETGEEPGTEAGPDVSVAADDAQGGVGAPAADTASETAADSSGDAASPVPVTSVPPPGPAVPPPAPAVPPPAPVEPEAAAESGAVEPEEGVDTPPAPPVAVADEPVPEPGVEPDTASSPSPVLSPEEAPDAADTATDGGPTASTVPGARAPRAYGAENTDARIVVRAIGDSWVQVTDGDDVLLTRLLRAGDTYRVPNRPGLTLNTGNAGTLEFSVDGNIAPPIGPTGAVRRDVALDPERLLTGTAYSDN